MNGRWVTMNCAPVYSLGFTNIHGVVRLQPTNIPVYHATSFMTSDPCLACSDITFIPPLVCTEGFFDLLRQDVIDPEPLLRFYAERGGIHRHITNDRWGFVVSDYIVGTDAYANIVAFADRLVSSPDVVITLRDSLHALAHGYGDTYVGRRLRYYKRSYTWFGVRGISYPCGLPSQFGAEVSLTVYFTALEDASDVNSRWNTIKYHLDATFYNNTIHHVWGYNSGFWSYVPASLRLVNKSVAMIKSLNGIAIVPADYGDYLDLLDPCSLCDIVEGINALVEANRWDPRENYFHRVRSIGYLSPRFESWMVFFQSLWNAIRPVYVPCTVVGTTFVQPVSVPDAVPWGVPYADQETGGLVGTLIYDQLVAGGVRYIPLMYTRAAPMNYGEIGTRSAVYLDTCSQGMVWLARSTRFASFVLFTIWFAMSLRRLITYLADGVRGGDFDG